MWDEIKYIWIKVPSLSNSFVNKCNDSTFLVGLKVWRPKHKNISSKHGSINNIYRMCIHANIWVPYDVVQYTSSGKAIDEQLTIQVFLVGWRVEGPLWLRRYGCHTSASPYVLRYAEITNITRYKILTADQQQIHACDSVDGTFAKMTKLAISVLTTLFVLPVLHFSMISLNFWNLSKILYTNFTGDQEQQLEQKSAWELTEL